MPGRIRPCQLVRSIRPPKSVIADPPRGVPGAALEDTMRILPILGGCALLALAACQPARTTGRDAQASTAPCGTCHGGADNSAPPVSTKGSSDTADVAVGAHQVHLHPGAFRKAVACDACHTVPETVGAPGHMGKGRAAVIFGGLASARGATPAWSTATASCATTYCHGGTLAGGSVAAPRWTQVDGTQAACGTCHGIPPPASSGHPPVDAALGQAACATCHPGTVLAGGALDVAGGQHIDGVVQVGAAACTGCHGDPARLPAELAPAPPRDSLGNTATTAVGVGAHLRHLQGGALRGPMACTDCHAVPASLDAHPSGAVDLTWGPLARAGGAAPSWSRATASCSATYCHGSTLTGGTRTAPVWTQVDGTQTRCGTCHGIPPPAPHVADQDCGKCHLGYTSTTVDPGTHVDGYIQVNGQTCTSCHGDPGRPGLLQAAPPGDVRGNVSTTAVGVGAHQAHLTGTSLRKPVACGECHAPVTSTSHAQGKNLVVGLAWGPLAAADGAHPAWNRGQARCASTYCHGGTLTGGTNTAPVWTKVDGTQAACGTCHGVPPLAPHVQRDDCGTCHPGYTPKVLNLATHMDGVLDAVTLRCTTCHGDATRQPAALQPAPPSDTRGNAALGARGVGAHQKHLVDGALSRAVACAECHLVPTVSNHADGTVGVTFGRLARTAGATPAWSASALTCAATYCHGGTMRGGTVGAPQWTRVDGTQTACGACHGVPPPAPHVQGLGCAGCHAGYTDRAVDVATHMDGVVQAQGSCTSCHGDPLRAGDAGQAPPQDTAHNTATTARGVGAHQKHLLNGALRAAVACTECHPLPSGLANHPDRTVDVTFGPLARSGGATPTWVPATLTCATTYCHGATVAGGAATAPVWTRVDGSQATCTSCHGNPPPAPHPANSACGTCHSGYTSTTVNLAAHVNGVVEASGSCTSCHGDPVRPVANQAAPPLDRNGRSGATLRGVGAHLQHLTDGTMRRAVACTECHVVPANLTAHPDGTTNLTWGPLARTGGVTPAWNPTTLTCATTYCHGATTGGGTLKAPAWTRVDGTQAACGTCHGVPPPAPHVQNTACGGCHAGYTATTVNLTTHVDGQVQASGMTCSSCHGDPGRVLVTGADAQTRSAPPLDTQGRSGTSLRGVGAHLAHLNRTAGAVGAPTACGECHAVPSSMTHSNGRVEVAFGTRARTGGAAPTYDSTSLTCSATYCHGQGLKGGSKPVPAWNQALSLGCATCHAAPPNDNCHPPSFNHEGGNSCSSCHRHVNAAGTAVTNARLHVNGIVEGKCTDCHRNEARVCN